jgi:signal peptidase II
MPGTPPSLSPARSQPSLLRPVLVAGSVIVLDIVTKRWALSSLDTQGTVHVLGGLLPLTLAYNTGIAFGIGVGAGGRGLLIALTAVIIVGLGVLYRRARPGDPYRWIGIALVAGGAVGNLLDRLRWNHGVVDFIGPIDLGVVLFPIFNMADVAITLGAFLLAASIGWEERSGEAAPPTRPGAAPANTADDAAGS